MGKLVNRVPELLRRKGISERDFVGDCIKAGLSIDTANRFLRGETNFSAGTIATVARMLGVSKMGEVIELSGEQ